MSQKINLLDPEDYPPEHTDSCIIMVQVLVVNVTHIPYYITFEFMLTLLYYVPQMGVYSSMTTHSIFTMATHSRVHSQS